jgi:hypothetical protein
MKDAIKEKLILSLGGTPGSEAEVVYTFVEIRKLLEREHEKGESKALTFFCDWLLHVELNRGNTPDMLSVLDGRLANLDLTRPDDVGDDAEVHRFISFEVLKEELERFCDEMELPDNWATDPTSWYECVKFYGQVVRDCALTVNRSGRANKYIQKIVLTTTESRSANDRASFKFDWEFTLSDGILLQQSQTVQYPSPSSRASNRPSFTELGL